MGRVILLCIIWCLAQLAHLIALIWLLLAAITNSNRAWEISLGYDHLFNAVTGGKPKETISRRANRARLAGRPWGCALCKLLDKIDPRHCEKSGS
jgi:hypothetical protein